MISLKKVVQVNLILICFIVFSIFFIDKYIAAFIAKHLTVVKPFFFYFTEAFDNVFYHIIWFIILSVILGVLFIFNSKTRRISFALFTVVFSVIGTYGVITSKMKTEFKRARPEAYMIGDGQTTDFFNKKILDYSFPSSHASFYLSLTLPFALMFRKYALPILIIPAIITAGRVVQNVHYLSDVVCSTLIVLNFCLLSFWVLHQIENIWFSVKRKKATANTVFYGKSNKNRII